MFIARAKHFDEKIKAYITEHPEASVVNLGAGLETTFYRVDNGTTIHWYDLDLPTAIKLRRQLIPETERITYIAKSFLDPSWCDDINTGEGVFMIAGALFYYFEDARVREFFSMLADNLPGSENVFDAQTKPGYATGAGAYGALDDQNSPEVLDIMKAEALVQFKLFWEYEPQDLKDMMIASLTTSVKPGGMEWTDFEAWRNKLSTQEVEEASHCFGGAYNGFQKGVGMWTLNDAHELAKRDSRITLIDQFPMFKNIPRDSLSTDIRQFMDYNDKVKG